mgnify:CR=1 FL=1
MDIHPNTCNIFETSMTNKEKIMDGWGSLTMLLKRQNSDKYRKAQLRHELQKKKENFLSNQESATEFDFPKVSDVEMERIKADIRADFRKQRIKNRIISVFILIAVIMFLAWFVNAKTGAIKEFLQ